MNKRVLSLFFFCLPAILLLNGACVTARSSDFKLDLAHNQRERSKDSHSQDARLSIADGIARYSVKHGGRDPRPDGEHRYALSAAQEERLIAYIREQALFVDLREERPAGSIGRSIHLDLTISIGPERRRARLVGMTADWKKRGAGGPASNLENLSYYKKVRSLLIFMRRQLGFAKIES